MSANECALHTRTRSTEYLFQLKREISDTLIFATDKQLTASAFNVATEKTQKKQQKNWKMLMLSCVIFLFRVSQKQFC